MTKFKTLLLTIPFISICIFSQNKTVEIKIEGKRTLTGLKTSKNNNFLIKTSKHIVMAKYSDGKLRSYDKDLNLVYDIKIKENDFIGNPFYDDNTRLSNFGNYYFNVNQLINRKGEIKPYKGTVKSNKKIYKESNINPNFQFFNDYGYTVIGPAKGRKNQKKKYEDGDIKIWSLKNKDLTSVSNTLESANFTTNRKKNTTSFYLGDALENTFFLMSKDLVNSQRNIDTYNVVSYSYEGEINKLIQLRIQLDSGYFTYVKTNLGLETEQKYELPGIGFLGLNHIKFNTKTFFVYGFYNTSSKNRFNDKEISGLYIQKFDSEGKLLWKKQYPLTDKIKVTFRQRTINLSEIGNRGYLDFSTKNEKDRTLITFDTESGEKLNNSSGFTKKYRINKSNWTKKEVKYFNAIYSEKVFPKKYFSANVILCFYYNPKIKEYLSSVKNNSYLYYDASFDIDGNIVLKEFSGKKRILKLLKFSK